MIYEDYRKCLSAAARKDMTVFKDFSEREEKIIRAVSARDISSLINSSGIKNVSGLCRKYSIPSKTVYRWLNNESDIPDYIIEHIGFSEICENKDNEY